MTRRELTRTITLTTLDFAKSDGADILDRQSVPECPKPISDGVVDIGNERWRFHANSLTTYIRYRASGSPMNAPMRFAACWQAHG